jgi:PilZ domain
MASHNTKRGSLISDMRNGLDHRWGTRVRVGIPVSVEAAELPRASTGYVKNLSVSGALLNCEYDLPLHALIQVSIDLPASACTGVVKAHISRKCNEGVGIEWCDFAPALVKDLLRSAAGLPSR